MSAFDALDNLVQTIHNPPQAYVLLSSVARSSWQLKLFLVSSELRCFVSAQREEISKDRKLVAGDKEGAFKNWTALAAFISEKIVKGDLHVAGWGSPQLTLVVDPGRPSSITIPLTALPTSEAAAAITDLVYSVANDARQHRNCALLPAVVAQPSQGSQGSQLAGKLSKQAILPKKRSLEKVTQPEEDQELVRLRTELAEVKEALRIEQAKPKADGPKQTAAPPKAIPGDSKAKPGQKHRVIQRAQFESDDEEDEEEVSPRKKPANGVAVKKAEPIVKPKIAPKPPPKARVAKRAEFADSDDDEEDEPPQASKKRKKA